MKKLPSLITFVVLAIFWEIYVALKNIPIYVLPSPSKIITAFYFDFENILKHSKVTLIEALLGISISLLLAIFIAILMDISPFLKKCVYPLLITSQTIPVIVLTPLLVIYFGFGLAPKILVVVLMCFFPICVNLVEDFQKTNDEYASLIKNFGGNKYHLYKIVKIPACRRAIISGLKISATYSIGGAVIAEWIGAKEGLGYYLIRLQNSYVLDKVFASVLAIVILCFILQFAIFLIEKGVFYEEINQNH